MSTDYEKMSDRELDAMVAMRLFGYEWQDVRAKGETNTHRVLCKPNTIHDGEWMMFQLLVVGAPDYTTDPSAWWGIILKMRADMFGYTITSSGADHFASFGKMNGNRPVAGDHTNRSAGRAVCIAALRALDAQTGVA